MTADLIRESCYSCTFHAESECDHCGKGFCREHGDPGGDRDTESGTRAYQVPRSHLFPTNKR